MENNIENFDPSLVYFGERGQDFKKMIRSILSLGMSDEYIPYLTTPESLNTYNTAFTSRGADDKNNYEMFEQLGDVSVNKFIVNYMYKRFPQLRNPNGVDVVAKLKINMLLKINFRCIRIFRYVAFLLQLLMMKEQIKETFVRRHFRVILWCN